MFGEVACSGGGSGGVGQGREGEAVTRGLGAVRSRGLSSWLGRGDGIGGQQAGHRRSRFDRLRTDEIGKLGGVSVRVEGAEQLYVARLGYVPVVLPFRGVLGGGEDEIGEKPCSAPVSVCERMNPLGRDALSGKRIQWSFEALMGGGYPCIPRFGHRVSLSATPRPSGVAESHHAQVMRRRFLRMGIATALRDVVSAGAIRVAL
jgi:hypothetical protein